MRNIYIIGAGGHGRVVLDIINKSEQFQAAAFLDDDSTLHNQVINDLKVAGSSDQALADDKAVIIAVGNNEIRTKLFELMNNDLVIINAVHPDAVINSYVKLGRGNVMAAGAVINSNTKIYDNVIINTGTTVDHDCIIESHVHLSPGVNLGGDVKVKAGAHIGIGAAVLPGVIVGRNSVVGAGAVVTKDVPDDVTVVGVPAKVR